MDLKACLKCILSFVLYFWKSEIVSSMECELGLLLPEPGVDITCYPPTETNRPFKENCQLLSCRQNETVQWKMIDKKKGRMQVQFRGLPKHCNFEAYVLELEIYDEKAPYNESLMCDTVTTLWRTHSKRTLVNTICPNCTLQPPEDCLQEHVVNFKYVYAGFYRLKITPYVNGSMRQAQRSYRFDVSSTETNYIKKHFSGLYLNASFQYRSTSQELDLGIPLLIDDPPEAMKVEVKYSDDYLDLYDVIIHVTEDSSSMRCGEKEKALWPSCHVHKGGIACKFFNLTEGFYSVYVSFTDDRCIRGTVWVGNGTDPCFWVIKKDFTGDKNVSNALSSTSSASQILFTCLVIIILIGIIVISFVGKKIVKRRQESNNSVIRNTSESARKVHTERTYSFSNGYANRFNIGQLLTLTDRPKPEVLLLYARETHPFMELVACFRRVLSKVFKCQVYDYYDSDLWNEVSEDPKGWIYSLIVHRQVKVIIIASEVAAMQRSSATDDSFKSPHPFDHLLLYAIRLVRDIVEEDSYKNRFVITFDCFTESHHLLEYFNPYTRFVLPKHLYKLFEHLHESSAVAQVDISRLEERPEVRQLRLQLEHIINLKLLAN